MSACERARSAAPRRQVVPTERLEWRKVLRAKRVGRRRRRTLKSVLP